MLQTMLLSQQKMQKMQELAKVAAQFYRRPEFVLNTPVKFYRRPESRLSDQ